MGQTAAAIAYGEIVSSKDREAIYKKMVDELDNWRGLDRGDEPNAYNDQGDVLGYIVAVYGYDEKPPAANLWEKGAVSLAGIEKAIGAKALNSARKRWKRLVAAAKMAGVKLGNPELILTTTEIA